MLLAALKSHLFCLFYQQHKIFCKILLRDFFFSCWTFLAIVAYRCRAVYLYSVPVPSQNGVVHVLVLYVSHSSFTLTVRVQLQRGADEDVRFLNLQ